MRLTGAREYWFEDWRERICIVHWTAGKRNRQQLLDRCALVLAAIKSQTATDGEQATAATRDKCFDAAQLVGSKETRLDAADDQAVIREKLFFGFWKTVCELCLVADALAVKLVLAGALKRNESDVLFVGLDRFANLAEFPAWFAFDVQNAQRSLDHFHQRVLLVVFDRQLAVEWRDFNRVAMHARSGRRDLEVDCLSVVAAQVEFFRFHGAAVFAHAQQNFRLAVTTEPDDRFDIQSRTNENAAWHVDARELGVHWSRSVAHADGEHRNVASAQFSQNRCEIARHVRRAVGRKHNRRQRHT